METATKVLGTIDACLFVSFAGIVGFIFMGGIVVWLGKRMKVPDNHWLKHALPAVSALIVVELFILLVIVFRVAISWVWNL